MAGRKPINLSGRRVGSLTAIAMAGSIKRPGGSRLLWLCKCDCGRHVVARSHRLLYSSAHLSCGCIPTKRVIRRKYPTAVSSLAAKLFRDYLWSANKAGREFSLSIEEFNVLIYATCKYCGIPPGLVGRGLQGIDRVNNDRGYTSDNVVPCCKYCNRAKRDMPLSVFTEWLDRIVAYRSPCQNQI